MDLMVQLDAATSYAGGLTMITTLTFGLAPLCKLNIAQFSSMHETNKLSPGGEGRQRSQVVLVPSWNLTVVTLSAIGDSY